MGRKDPTAFDPQRPAWHDAPPGPDRAPPVKAPPDPACGQQPIQSTMNIWLSDATPGRVTFRGIPEHRHTNHNGDVHAGWPATLLDSALGCAIMTRAPEGMGYSTLELNTTIIQRLNLGEEVEAVADVQHFGRSTGMATAEVRGVENGILYATGTVTCLILPMPVPVPGPVSGETAPPPG